jgi:D-aminopeptidase
MDQAQVPRRARDLGIVIGSLAPGPLNAITDVGGVRVGHTTLIDGESIRTGVTAIVPEQLGHRPALTAGLYVGNGHGKMVGSTQLAELGEIETPVLLTATLPTSRGAVTIGVLVQSNFSGVLRVLGVPIPRESVGVPIGPPATPGNSCVIVVATDGRFDARQLSRLARRAVFAMGRVGSDFAGGSGDYAIAFTTSAPDGPPAPESDLEPAFAAVLESVEEALLNSLFMAETTSGFRGHVKYAVPHGRMLDRLAGHGFERAR